MSVNIDSYTIKWVTVPAQNKAHDEIDNLKRLYGLNNITIMESPQKLMGNYKTLVLAVHSRKLLLKMEGPEYIMEEINNELVENGVRMGFSLNSTQIKK